MTKRTNIFYAFMLCLMAVFVLSMPANAVTTQDNQPEDEDCILGLPCVTTRTTNSPWDDVISQNQDDAPNYLKSTRDTCDADFMNQIYARAALEAERENVMIESIIAKPDSVLEYTCFEPMMNAFAYHAPRIFSETTEFSTSQGGASSVMSFDGIPDDEYLPEGDADPGSNIPIQPYQLEVYMGEGHMGNALENLILKTLVDSNNADSLAYIDANFYHTFLGGAPVGLNNNFSGEIDPVFAPICAQMNLSWFLAKCQNFNPPGGFFWRLEELAVLDPRLFPKSCSSQANNNNSGNNNPPQNNQNNNAATEPVGSMLTLQNILLSRNPMTPVGGIYANVDSTHFITGDPTQFRPGLPLPTNRSYEDFLAAGSCLPPIETGVKVITRQYSTSLLGKVTHTEKTHKEHLCVNPGCYHEPPTSGSGAGQCKRAP